MLNFISISFDENRVYIDRKRNRYCFARNPFNSFYCGSTLKANEMGFHKRLISLRNGVCAEMVIVGPYFMLEAITQVLEPRQCLYEMVVKFAPKLVITRDCSKIFSKD
jgi:hypothetical protein